MSAQRNILVGALLLFMITHLRAQSFEDTSLDSLLNITVSTATKYGQTTREAPASVSIVTSEEIERFGYQTLEDVFRSVRGFYVSNDRNYSYLGARGFGRPTDYNSRVLILLNGYTTNENTYGSGFIGSEIGMDLQFVDRIEIVRGPGSSLYGTGAMFAVVNVITKTGNSINGGNVGAELGSHGRRRGTFRVGEKTESGVEYSLAGAWKNDIGGDIYFKEFDDPSTNFGVANHLDWDKNYGIHGAISYGGFSAQAMLSSRKKGIPTGAWGSTFNYQGTHSLDEFSFGELKYALQVAAEHSFNLRTYYHYYSYQGEADYGVPSYDETVGKWFGSEAQYRWDISSANRFTAGVEYRSNPRSGYRYWDVDAEYFSANVPFTVWSIYVQDAFQLRDDLSITLGVRRDMYSTVGSATTPRAALVYNPLKGSTVKILYGEAFRAPNFYEFYLEDPQSGSKGNPALQPERIKTFEAICEQRLTGDLFGSVSYFSYRVNNLIDQVIDPVDSFAQFQNVSIAKAHGVEWGLEFRSGNGHNAFASYAYQFASDASSGQHLTNSPIHLLKIGGVTRVAEKVFLSADGVYESTRRTVYDTETGSAFVTNLTLSTGYLFDHAKLSIGVRNLFDVSYKTPGGLEHLQDAIIQDGRNIFARVDVRF